MKFSHVFRSVGLSADANLPNCHPQTLTPHSSLSDLASIVEDDMAAHLGSVLPLILESLPGRLWDGKEILLDVLVSLAKACKLVRVLTQF